MVLYHQDLMDLRPWMEQQLRIKQMIFVMLCWSGVLSQGVFIPYESLKLLKVCFF